MYAKLISNIEILAVKDASGQPVFQNIDEGRVPAMIIFAVPEEYYILLKKASYMRSYETTIDLVVSTIPGNVKYMRFSYYSLSVIDVELCNLDGSFMFPSQIQSVVNPTVLFANHPIIFGKGGRL